MKSTLKLLLTLLLSGIYNLSSAQIKTKIDISTSGKQVTINGNTINSKSTLEDYTNALGSSDRVEKKAKQINYVYDSLGIVLETIEGNPVIVMRIFVGAAATVKEPSKAFSGTLNLNSAKIQSNNTLSQIQAKTTGMKWVETAGVGMTWKEKTFLIGIDAKGGKVSRLYFSLN